MKPIKLFCVLTVFCFTFNIFNCFEIERNNILKNVENFEYPQNSIYDYEAMDVPEIIASFGYPIETHHVTTEDGYILGVHRIPYGVNGTSSQNPRPVVILQHGIQSSSFAYIADRPGRALAYILADAGYDVWINNIRGNAYSRNHTTLDPDVDKKTFWAFTYDEMGLYDIPAVINYTLSTTSVDQVFYVGYSMGTTMFFIMTSEKPDIIDKIKAVSLMAPVVYMNNVKGATKFAANYSDSADKILSALGIYELPGTTGEVSDFQNKYCSEGNKTAPICYFFTFIGTGFDPVELNKELFPVIKSHEPGGTSFHTVNHYAQQILTDVFQRYDWGIIGNQEHYGQDTPPPINTTGPQPPLAFFVGPNDFLATPQDVERLSGEVQNLQLNHLVEWDKWNHIDFCWGIHAKEYVYDYIVEYFSTF